MIIAKCKLFFVVHTMYAERRKKYMDLIVKNKANLNQKQMRMVMYRRWVALWHKVWRDEIKIKRVENGTSPSALFIKKQF